LSDIFEVMAQVDRCLTKVNTVDRLIRVNNPTENLGRHPWGVLNLALHKILGEKQTWFS
jgi:hypothetical protein